jgi:hypothetical protein
VQHDPALALQFLSLLYPEGPWVVTCIEVDQKGIYTETFGPGREREFEAFIRKHAACNCYYSVNRPIHGEVTSKLDRESIEAVHYLHVDIDPRACPSGEDPVKHLASEQDRIRLLLENPPQGIPRPTFAVKSGGGWNAGWALEEPIQIAGDLALAESTKLYNLALELAFGADSTHDISRILRLPHSVNYPNAKKRSRGRVAAMAALAWFEDHRRFPISRFTPAPPIQNKSLKGFAAPAGSRSPTAPRVSGNVPRLASIHDLPDTVPEKTKVLIVQGKNPEDAGTGDRSRHVFAVCCALVRAGVDDGLIYSILTDPEYGISAHVLAQPSKDRYALRQIERAKEFAIDPHLLELNARHAVVENIGGRCRIIEEKADEAFGGRLMLTFQTFDDFRNVYMHRRVTCGFNNKGQPIEIPLGKWWLEQAARRQYRSITFSPGRDIEGAYNMWRGFAVEPRPGNKHQKFLDHVRDNLCNGNPDLYQYLMGWMARAVQKPDATGEVAVVLRGRKGTGKSLFVKTFGALFGRHFWQVSDARHIVGNFNAHLRDCVVLFADEAFWAGDKKHESVLKALITEETIVVERKGVDAEAAPNYVHLIMASNAQWVVPASEDERRFLVLDVAATHIQDKAYFGAVDADLKTGSHAGSLGDGYGHLLHALQTWDISNFDHRTVPHTEALSEQKIHSLETHEEWWFGKLRDGMLQPLHAGWLEPIPKDQLLDDYLSYAQRIGGKRASATTVTHLLDRVCPGMEQWHGSFRGRDVNGDPVIGRTLYLRFPSLKICREAFEGKCGGSFKWPDIGEREIQKTQDPF